MPVREFRALGLTLRAARFYQAFTSELFGLVQETPQKETKPLYPAQSLRLRQAVRYRITINYREAYGTS